MDAHALEEKAALNRSRFFYWRGKTVVGIQAHAGFSAESVSFMVLVVTAKCYE
jgi:hypothetical protein